MSTTIIGFPRLGEFRELKFTTEKYFRNEITADELLAAAKDLRAKHWNIVKEKGITEIPSNDFSHYDNFLDAAFLFNVVPESVKNLDLTELEQYFALARGYQGEKGDVRALPMKKWFNTNYHYIVPKFEKTTAVKLAGHKIFDEYQEAKDLGLDTRPVVVGTTCSGPCSVCLCPSGGRWSTASSGTRRTMSPLKRNNAGGPRHKTPGAFLRLSGFTLLGEPFSVHGEQPARSQNGPGRDDGNGDTENHRHRSLPGILHRLGAPAVVYLRIYKLDHDQRKQLQHQQHHPYQRRNPSGGEAPLGGVQPDTACQVRFLILRPGRDIPAQQLVGGDAQHAAQQGQCVNVRRGLLRLPFGHRLTGHSHQLAQLLLRQPRRLAHLLEPSSKGHGIDLLSELMLPQRPVAVHQLFLENAPPGVASALWGRKTGGV